MRSDSIVDEVRERLFAYVFGIVKNFQIELLAIGGTANHLDILIALSARRSLSDTVRDIKSNSSRWMSENHPGFSWQESFGAFSVSPSQVRR